MAYNRYDTLGVGVSAGALQIELQIEGRSRIGQKLTRVDRYVQDLPKLTLLVFCLPSAQTASRREILHGARFYLDATKRKLYSTHF